MKMVCKLDVTYCVISPLLYVYCLYEYIIPLQVKVAEGIPLKRLGKPEEVAGMTTFLALNPAADYITGHCFNVDGGIAMGA